MGEYIGCSERAEHTDTLKTIPYVAFETAQEKYRRNFKRMIIALILAVVIIVASNAVWLCAYKHNVNKCIGSTTECLSSLNAGDKGS